MNITSYGQSLSPWREKEFNPEQDTIQLDSLGFEASSFELTHEDGRTVDRSMYTLLPFKGLLIWKAGRSDTLKLKARYQAFPFLPEKKYFNKDPLSIQPDESGMYNPFSLSVGKQEENFFDWGELSKNGSISRGISLGNNQDAVVSSNLNLQLSGKLSEDIRIKAAITDNNIPIQPEGNTQQIQEFDKVFVELSSKNTKLIAGDFEIKHKENHFLSIYKKAQGASISTRFPEEKIYLSGSGAISKGKFARNTIQGIEGNQGPYKLRGSNNESFIMVLAGTERVFLDGKLLTRGQDQDYVIDYNTAELTFTPKNLITKDKRIVVEFEYSDRNYSRSAFFAGGGYQGEKLKIGLQLFSEQDLKNQPLLQELTEGDKTILANAGDSLSTAVVPNADSIAYTNNEVLYKIIDTTVNSVLYDSVFVYSTSEDSAFYRLGFSLVGENNGNYVQIQSSANGKVFQWVAPVNGVPQGNYEPVSLLIAPEKKQFAGINLLWTPTQGTKLYFDGAVSVHDINTFSKIDKNNDTGLGFQGGLEKSFRWGSDSILKNIFTLGIEHEFADKYLSPPERYRPVEFEREWNYTPTKAEDEHRSLLFAEFSAKNHLKSRYQLERFASGSKYEAYRQQATLTTNWKGLIINGSGSIMNSENEQLSTSFLKHKLDIKKRFKYFEIGAAEEHEYNNWRAIDSDSLLANSFRFSQYQLYASTADTAKNVVSVFWKKRYDELPKNETLVAVSESDDIGFTYANQKNRKQQFKLEIAYRKLQIKDSALSSGQQDESTLLGRLEYNLRLLKGAIISNTFYEAGSGLEVKKEFSYLEVAAGQGSYSWTDYNENGVKELNEFEVALFQDQASYIRVYTPTNNYVRTYSNQFTEVLNIDPARYWKGKSGFQKTIRRFSNRSSLRIAHKTSGDDILKAYNPFSPKLDDSLLLSLNSSFRNSLFFNKSHPKFGMEFAYRYDQNKVLLTQGFESRSQESGSLNIRWNITRKINLQPRFSLGNKKNNSEYFSSRDYLIQYHKSENIIRYQPGRVFRLSLNYTYTNKENTIGDPKERAKIHQGGIEMKYSFLSKGSLLAQFNYFSISYNAESNSSLAFEMLEGLKKGNNGTWNLTYQRNISNNLQLNLRYEGRKSPDVKTVHVGSVQLRAYF